MIDLKPCPGCGKTPERLMICDNGQGGKWGNATCPECGEWMVEFRTGYHPFDSPECMEQAVIYWNDAPRPLVDRITELEAQIERMKECARNNIGTYNTESDEAFERIANGCPKDAER